MQAVQARRSRTTRAPGRVRQRRVLAGQLRERVDAARGGRSSLGVRLGAAARRRRSWCSRWTSFAPCRGAALGESLDRADVHLARPRPSSRSHTSTLWNAAQLKTSVGRSASNDARPRAPASVTSSSLVAERLHLAVGRSARAGPSRAGRRRPVIRTRAALTGPSPNPSNRGLTSLQQLQPADVVVARVGEHASGRRRRCRPSRSATASHHRAARDEARAVAESFAFEHS